MDEPAITEPETCCCGRDMAALANAVRNGHGGGVHRVTVYQCQTCKRTTALGESCDPYWVSAKARLFLDLRWEAFRRAGLTALPAAAIFDTHKQHVIFG
jgi:hypothetical protein